MVDDEPAIGAMVMKLAEGVGYEMEFTDQAEAFKLAYVSFQPDVVILDLAIPDTDGVELLDFLVLQNCRARVLLMSGIDPRIRDLVHRLGVARGLTMSGIIPKPVRAKVLRSVLRDIMDQVVAEAPPGHLTMPRR